MDWLSESIFWQIAVLAGSLIIARIVIQKFLASLVRRAVRSHKNESSLGAKKREDTLVRIIGASLTIVLWLIGIITLLGILGMDLAGLLASAGVIGVIIGIGGQNAIKDILAGFFILIENQYRVGDIITLDTVSGVVENITLRITKLRDLDGNLHIVPNGSIVVVTNRTFGWANVNMDIGVSYSSDIDLVRRVINDTGEAMLKSKEWNNHILEPIKFLRVESFSESAVTVKALGKVIPGKQWDVAGEFRGRLKKAFEKHGIEIPFPQRVIHQSGKK